MAAATVLLTLQHGTSAHPPDSQSGTLAISSSSLPVGPAVHTTIEEVEDVDRKLANTRQRYQALNCLVTGLSYRGHCLPSDSVHLLDLDPETPSAPSALSATERAKSDPGLGSADSTADYSKDVDFLEKWVGCNKLWDDSAVPDSIKSARNAAREVPSWALRACTPTPDVTVAAVLKNFVPPPNTCTSHYESSYLSSPNSFYSVDPPDTLCSEEKSGADVARLSLCISTSRIGPTTLHSMFNQEWLAGKQSIHFPSLSPFRFPLWMEKLVQEVNIFTAKRMAWSKAVDWLHGMDEQTTIDARTLSLAVQCRQRIADIPWNSVVPGFSAGVHLVTRSLSSLLGYDWLDDEIINAGGEYITRQLGLKSRSHIVNCLLPIQLDNMRARSTTYSPSKVRTLDTRIRAHELDRLFIPLHVHGNHWTLVIFDLKSRTYMYADSRDASAQVPRQSINILRWWIEALLPGRSFASVPADFTVPQQLDFNSCGVVVLSIMAYLLLGYDQWSQNFCDTFRMLWFLRLSEVYAANRDVSILHNIPQPI